MQRSQFTLLASFALLLAVGCGSKTGAEGSSEVFVAGKEAKAWLASPDNTLLKIGNEAGVQWTERLYSEGADSVKICNTSKVGANTAGETASSLGVAPPKDTAGRKKFWPILNELEVAFGAPKSADTGQTAIVLTAK